MRIQVYGVPAAQGSKSYVGNGIMIDSDRRLKPWRYAVISAIVEAKPSPEFQFTGPIALLSTFTFPKPKSAPKTRVTYPVTALDIDKCVRAIGDSLTQSGVIVDDSRIIFQVALKSYPGQSPDALASPGVVIRIEEYTGRIPEGWLEHMHSESTCKLW